MKKTYIISLNDNLYKIIVNYYFEQINFKLLSEQKRLYIFAIADHLYVSRRSGEVPPIPRQQQVRRIEGGMYISSGRDLMDKYISKAFIRADS